LLYTRIPALASKIKKAHNKMSSDEIPPAVLQWYKKRGITLDQVVPVEETVERTVAPRVATRLAERIRRRSSLIIMANRKANVKVFLFKQIPMFDSVFAKLQALGFKEEDSATPCRVVSIASLALELTLEEKQQYWDEVQRAYTEDCVAVVPEIRLIHRELRVHTRVGGDQRELVLRLLELGYIFGEPGARRWSYVRIKG